MIAILEGCNIAILECGMRDAGCDGNSGVGGGGWTVLGSGW